MRDDALLLRWTDLTAICGILAFTVYPIMAFVDLPVFPLIVLVAAFGPLLGLASLGLSRLMQADRPSLALTIAPIFNLFAVAIVTMMLMIQLAVRQIMPHPLSSLDPNLSTLWRGLDRIQLSLDVAWDVYIGIGTFLFGMAMVRHPHFGKIFGISGMGVALALLAFNLYTFPIPPTNASLIDIGPAVALWYVVVMVRVVFLRKSFVARRLHDVLLEPAQQ